MNIPTAKQTKVLQHKSARNYIVKEGKQAAQHIFSEIESAARRGMSSVVVMFDHDKSRAVNAAGILLKSKGYKVEILNHEITVRW